MFDLASNSPIHFAKDAPLRPELIESMYLLYCVTRHPSYLNAAAEMLRAINTFSRVRCGYASIADVSTKRCVPVCQCASGPHICAAGHKLYLRNGDNLRVNVSERMR